MSTSEEPPLDVKQHVDQLCNQLEMDFAQDNTCRVEAYLPQISDKYRAFALFELLGLELELRGDETTGPDELANRFPGYADVLARLSCLGDATQLYLDDALTVSTGSIGSKIGPYKLIETIGEGGMGVVYIAEQREPVKRRVALKIIKPGMDTKEVLARFEIERQALAMMEHTNIARVLDAGTTDAGRPYFVMELVRGVPITDFCDQSKSDANERLKLFIDVCHAIQHAHQKGIIHRDIKPSNVLVSSHNGTPVVKVIDFGVAKAIHQSLTDQSVYTRFSQIVGTPLYMSPEQANMSSLDVDTRTDVYSLGVLLYELLTGQTPFDRQRFRNAAYVEMQRIIKEEEPSKPSTRISILGDNASEVSVRRQSNPRKLQQSLRGDLDWIVMKALEKDRTRRYETASGFADDVQRFLQHEPVLASPPSRSYKLKKFLHRNRKAAVAGAILSGALVLGCIGTTSGMLWAVREKRIADTADATSTQVSQLLSNILETADPSLSLGRELTVLEVLDSAAVTIERENTLPPAVEARVRLTIGNTYQRLGAFDKAIRHLSRAVELQEGAHDSDRIVTAHAHAQRAGCQFEIGDYGEAIQSCERTLAIHAEAGVVDIDTVLAHRTIADCYLKLDDRIQSRKEMMTALQVAESLAANKANRLELAVTLNSFGVLEYEDGHLAKAIEFVSKCLNIREELLTEQSPLTARSKTNLAALLMQNNNFDKAKTLLEESAKTQRVVLPEDDVRLAATLQHLAAIEINDENYASANEIISEALRIRNLKSIADNDQLVAYKYAAICQLQLGEFKTAIESIGRACTIVERNMTDAERKKEQLSELGGIANLVFRLVNQDSEKTDEATAAAINATIQRIDELSIP